MPDTKTIIEPRIKEDPFDGTKSLTMAIVSCTAMDILISGYFHAPSEDGSRDNALSIVPYAISTKYGKSDGGLLVSSSLLRGDTSLSVLFDDGSILTKDLTDFSDNSYKWSLSDEDCECFLFKKIRIIRAQSVSSSHDFSFEDQSVLYKELPELFQTLIEVFLEAAAKEVKWAPSSERNIQSPHKKATEDYADQADYCYVYLMNDTSTGYYKIGMSNNPEYRETTLQSQKPTIVKICHKRYPSRRIAKAIEAALHKVYESKRIRGEWFSLKERDIWEVKQTLS